MPRGGCLVLRTVCAWLFLFPVLVDAFSSSWLVTKPASLPGLRIQKEGFSLTLQPAQRRLQALKPSLRTFKSQRSSLQPSMISVQPPPDFERIPISLLSGFLGAGKTTLLREMLENKGGMKVGVIVNDVAEVNIDSKLVKSDSIKPGTDSKEQKKIAGEVVDVSDVMELQNGCACCSASDELLTGILKLLAVGADRGEPFDRIVIELSGVSEPKNMRRQFFELDFAGHPALDYCNLQNMVTVVDGANFLWMYQSGEGILERPDLVDAQDAALSGNRKLVDLLTEQVEVADYVLLNKADKVDDVEMNKLMSIVKSLNPAAEVVESSFGKVDLDIVLGSKRDKWVADGDDEDDFRVSVMDALKQDDSCTDPECTEESHGHTHASHSHDSSCSEPDCKDESHGHSHSHAHADSHADSCTDPECTDESHGHSHSHGETPESKFGITSFVYARRRPFHAERLKKVILQLPIQGNSEESESAWRIPFDSKSADPNSPLRNVVRSKGFVWLQNHHRFALYWSHAGQYFDLKDFGMFWVSTPLKFWPEDEEQLAQIVSDFGGQDNEWGDRRQEVVFIGVDIDRPAIEQLLDECLLTDEEMQQYKAMAASEKEDQVKIDYSKDQPVPVQKKVLA